MDIYIFIGWSVWALFAFALVKVVFDKFKEGNWLERFCYLFGVFCVCTLIYGVILSEQEHHRALIEAAQPEVVYDEQHESEQTSE